MNGKIVVFDSGLGGCFVLKKLLNIFPNEGFIYIADNAKMPYGRRTQKYLKRRINYLVSKASCRYKIKVLILACNTATAVALDLLRKQFDFPIIGMEPAIKPAIASGIKSIFVFSTIATANNSKLLKKYSCYSVKVVGFKSLARVIEKKLFDNHFLEKYIFRLVQPLKTDEECAIVLGCSHYRFVESMFKVWFPNATFFHNDEGVCQRVENVLIKQDYEQRKSNNNIVELIITKLDKNYICKFESILLEECCSGTSVSTTII